MKRRYACDDGIASFYFTTAPYYPSNPGNGNNEGDGTVFNMFYESSTEL
ncbi:hypothetical protein ACFOQM_03450 [Paenibacillus sp. GCM10012307]